MRMEEVGISMRMGSLTLPHDDCTQLWESNLWTWEEIWMAVEHRDWVVQETSFPLLIVVYWVPQSQCVFYQVIPEVNNMMGSSCLHLEHQKGENS